MLKHTLQTTTTEASKIYIINPKPARHNLTQHIAEKYMTKHILSEVIFTIMYIYIYRSEKSNENTTHTKDMSNHVKSETQHGATFWGRYPHLIETLYVKRCDYINREYISFSQGKPDFCGAFWRALLL